MKCIINDPVEVPGPMRDYYKKTADGTFALALDGEPAGYVKADKLAEFRENNIALKKTLAKFDGLDPDAARVALTKLATFDGVDPDEYRLLKARPDVTKRTAELEAELAAEKFKNTSPSNSFVLAGVRAPLISWSRLRRRRSR